MKLRNGDRAVCNIARILNNGLSIIALNDELGFVPKNESSWFSDSFPTRPLIDQFSPGERIEAIVLKTTSKPNAGFTFLGSIKRLHPKEDPWQDENFRLGQEFQSTLVCTTLWGGILTHPTGIYLPFDSTNRDIPKGLKVGDFVLAQIVKFDRKKRKAMSRILTR